MNQIRCEWCKELLDGVYSVKDGNNALHEQCAKTVAFWIEKNHIDYKQALQDK
jgi:hypothetical protein